MLELPNYVQNAQNKVEKRFNTKNESNMQLKLSTCEILTNRLKMIYTLSYTHYPQILSHARSAKIRNTCFVKFS